MEFAPDGRLFVAEKGGKLRVINTNGELLDQPFMDISGQVNARGERGLLGVAFHPDFASNKYVYVYYTRAASGGTPVHNRVVRLRPTPTTKMSPRRGARSSSLG
jgi:glucose/arabinose dehydrogenase